MRLRLICLLLFSFSRCTALLSWSDLSLRFENAVTAQRDISTADGVDQLLMFGILLNRVIFDHQGYTNASLPTLENFLGLKYGLFMLDLYWNHFTHKWQLCPGPIPAKNTKTLLGNVAVTWNNATYTCLPSFTINEVLLTVDLYLLRTNILLEANVVQLAFNLKSIYYEPPTVALNSSAGGVTNTSTVASTQTSDDVPQEYTGYGPDYLGLGNATLEESLSPLSSYLFLPSVLESWQQSTGREKAYPDQNTYLFSLYKRVLPFVLSNEIHNSSTGYNVSAQDRATLFFPGSDDFLPWIAHQNDHELSSNMSAVANTTETLVFRKWAQNTHFRIVFDDDTAPFTNKSASVYLKSGFSAILNSTAAFQDSNPQQLALDIANIYTPQSFWSWAPGEFFEVDDSNNTNTKQNLYDNTDNWYIEEDSQRAYLCVSATTDGWGMQNCYDKLRGICQNNNDPYMWHITAEISSYLEWGNELSCPLGYKIGVPRLGLEQLSLRLYLSNKMVEFPVWVDINDITISGCYVLGGPYALCPYQEAITTKGFVKNLAPSALVALFLIFLILCERMLLKTPIHWNRKHHWKKQIVEYYKNNDYEGVPL